MDRKTYLRLLRSAHGRTRRAGEAEDLLQAALLCAVEAGRGDMSASENRRWLGGVLRNRALHEARSAARRRRREADYALNAAAEAEAEAGASATDPGDFIATLPPGLRTTALLVVTGHTKPEIAWLLDLSDVALRQRISELKRRCLQLGLRGAIGGRALKGDLPFGLLRRALIGVVRPAATEIGTHDPDGHLFVVSSQIDVARQLGASNI